MQAILDNKDVGKGYDVIVYAKHGNLLEDKITYMDKNVHTMSNVAMNFEVVLQETNVGAGVLVICNPIKGGRTYTLLWPYPSIKDRRLFDDRVSGCNFEFYAGTASNVPWAPTTF